MLSIHSLRLRQDREEIEAGEREKDQITLTDAPDESIVLLLRVSLSLYLFMAGDERTCSTERR